MAGLRPGGLGCDPEMGSKKEVPRRAKVRSKRNDRMKTSLALALVAVAALFGCSSPQKLASGQPVPSPEWVLAYQSNFSDTNITNDSWYSCYGDMKMEGGKLLLLPESKRRRTGAFLHAMAFPQSYRVEVIGSITTKERPEYLSCTLSLNTYYMEPAFGYMFQFGTRSNTCSLIKKEGKVIDSTVNKQVRPEAGKTFRIVTERLGNKITVSVNGAPAATYTDDQPIEDPRCGEIALTSWGCTLAIDQVSVYTRKGHKEDIVTPPVAPPPTGTVVTLKGTRMNNSHLRSGPEWQKDRFVFLIAFDGPPEVKAEVEKIWADYHPGRTLDADAALELENQFKKRVLYYLDGPLAARIWKEDCYGNGHRLSVTGTLHEQDGRKYLTVTSFGPYDGPTYPERITAGPEVPVVKLPVKPGLTIKLSDTLTDTLIYVPAGKFYMGCSLAQSTHNQEGQQHMVTFAKGFYLSDHPILNSEYAAITGDKTRNPKNHPDNAACNMSCEMFDRYVKALQKLNPGKVIRAPSKSEWEYVARSGTSNLEFGENLNNRQGETCNRTVAVKSRKPNGWGFYGMVFNDGTERSCDDGFIGFGHFLPDATDPRFPCKTCQDTPGAYHIHSCGGISLDAINQLFNDEGYVGNELGGIQRNGSSWKLIRQRILVEE